MSVWLFSRASGRRRQEKYDPPSVGIPAAFRVKSDTRPSLFRRGAE